MIKTTTYNTFMYSTMLFIGIVTLISSCKKDTNDGTSNKNEILDGQIYLGPYNPGDKTGRVLVMDKNGNTIKEKLTPGVVMNVQKWNNNGVIRYTYLVEDNSAYHIKNFQGYIPGYFVIADENLNEIKRVYLYEYGAIDTSIQKVLDGHDFIYINDNHYITMTYYEKAVNNIPQSLNPAANLKVIAPVIQEIENNQVKWQWDGTDYPDLYSESMENNNYSDTTTIRDYLHINAFVIDPNDGQLICSFRNADLLLKLNRTTGAIIWRLGGKNSDFALSANQKFLRQHNVSFIDNGKRLLLFDNGDITLRPKTRILEFKLNETSKTIEDFSEFEVPGAFAQFMGSVQKTGDTYFINGGTSKYIMEVNKSTGVKTFEKSLEYMTYRAFKY